MRILSRLLLHASIAVVAAAPAFAQTASRPGSPASWAPWFGCWQVSQESINDGAQALGTAADRAAGSSPSRVCVTPAPGGGATITTFVKDQVVATESMVPDGTQRALDDPSCRGWQKAEWSHLGARLFARAEITCGDQPQRIVSGLSSITAGPVWLDIQLIESEGRKSLRVRRYHRTAQQPERTARYDATPPLGGKLTLAEIQEASQKVPADALQAAVLELGAGGYDLKAKQLLELDAAGVPDSVIDLMVAMSFPKRFVVERASSPGGFGSGWFSPADDMWGSLAAWPYPGLWSYYATDPVFSSFYGPYYSAFYSPFAYRYWGYFNPDYFSYGGVGSVVDGGSGAPPTATGNGRVVDGRGYTRIRRTEPETPARINGGTGDMGTASTGNAGTSGSSGSGSSGVSSGGYSSGGSSGGDRVAVPRPPGGR